MTFFHLAAYGVQIFAFATLIMTMFVTSSLHVRPDHPKSRTITQVNWLSIGAAIVAGAINITAIINGITAVLGIALFITVITTVLTAGCLYALSETNDTDDD